MVPIVYQLAPTLSEVAGRKAVRHGLCTLRVNIPKVSTLDVLFLGSEAGMICYFTHQIKKGNGHLVAKLPHEANVPDWVADFLEKSNSHLDWDGDDQICLCWKVSHVVPWINPFSQDLEIDTDAFRRIVENHINIVEANQPFVLEWLRLSRDGK